MFHDSVHKSQFWKRRERRAEVDRTKVLLLHQPSATPAHRDMGRGNFPFISDDSHKNNVQRRHVPVDNIKGATNLHA